MNKNIICLGTAFTLFLLLFASCIDKNEWEVDKSYDRLFSLTKLSVSADKTEAEVSWTVAPNTEYYIIEVSKDSLHNDIAIGASNGAIVYGQDKSITKTPYTLTGLEGSTKYYIRAKGVSETKEAHWTYLEKFYFQTKGEQIMQAVDPAEKTTNSVILRWEPAGIAVSHVILTYTQDGVAQERRVDLTADDIANGFVFIDELNEATTYTASIYNGENKRGEISFRTNDGIPQGGVTRTLDGTEDIVAYLDTVAASDLTLIIPAGSLYEPTWLNESAETQTSLKIPDHITALTIWGEEGTTQAVINTTSVKLGIALTKLKFKNIELRGKASNADYVVNESATRPIEEVSFDGCNINTYRGVFRLQNDLNTSHVSKISFFDCIVHTIEGYGLINGSAKVTWGDINIENCTFYNLKEVFVVLKSKAASITLKSCTFYNTIKTGKYYFDFKNGDTDCTPDNFGIEKCIFGKNYNLKAGETVRATNPGNKTTDFAFDTYVTSDCLFNTGYPMGGVLTYDKSSVDLFTNPDNADFSIKDAGFQGKEFAGDPRWR